MSDDKNSAATICYETVSAADDAGGRLSARGAEADGEIIDQLRHAVARLQVVLDRATLAGLVVKPSFKCHSGRFADRGSDADSYVAKVEVYRKYS